MEDTFECMYCKDEGLPKDEYTFTMDYLGGYDKKTEKPVCQDCANAAWDEMNAGK